MKSTAILTTALLALSMPAWAQTQSGSSIGSNPGTAGSINVDRSTQSKTGADPTRDSGIPATGTSADSAGAGGTTPRSDTSVSTSGAAASATPAASGSSSGRCDTLIGDERMKCMREQASTGTTR
jgi:hypothetical protein